MQYEVLKPFNTVTRRLQIGSTIADNEPLEPFLLEERLESGFLREKVEETPMLPPPVVPAGRISDADEDDHQ